MGVHVREILSCLWSLGMSGLLLGLSRICGYILSTSLRIGSVLNFFHFFTLCIWSNVHVISIVIICVGILVLFGVSVVAATVIVEF